MLPGAAERLVLFEAALYAAASFAPAIAGCQFVFLVATPLLHDTSSTKVTQDGRTNLSSIWLVARLSIELTAQSAVA